MTEEELEQFEYHNEHYYIILEGAYLADEIDEWTYHTLKRLKIENIDVQMEAFRMLIAGIEKSTLEERIIKGAEMIEKEQDPVIKRRYIDVYEGLISQLEQLKTA